MISEMEFEDNGAAVLDDSVESNSSDSLLFDDLFDETSIPTKGDSVSKITILSREMEFEDKPNIHTLLCPFCGRDFFNIYIWRKHVNAVHKLNKPENLNMEFFDDKTAKCKQCDAKIYTREPKSLQHHKITHLPFSQYVKCKICEQLFPHAAGHKKHIERFHADTEGNISVKGAAKFVCPFCGTEYTKKSVWRKHLDDLHEFNKLENLNLELSEDDDNVAKCKQCDMKISSREIRCLQRHKITHLPYSQCVKCTICPKKFASISSFMPHLASNYHKCFLNEKNNINAGGSKYILLCPICGIEFLNKIVWEHHLNKAHEFDKRENLNMKFFNTYAKCQECGKKLTGLGIGALQLHKIVHLPYNRCVKCKICSKKFMNGKSFQVHSEKYCQKAEMDERSSKYFILLCPDCGKKFPNKIVWRKHLNDVHKLNKRETLNMEFLDGDVCKCNQCQRLIKSRDFSYLQAHTFSHLPFSHYVVCKICTTKYNRISRIYQHFKKTHPYGVN